MLDGDAVAGKRAGEGRPGELRALIGVKDVRLAVTSQSIFHTRLSADLIYWPCGRDASRGAISHLSGCVVFKSQGIVVRRLVVPQSNGFGCQSAL
jgi:hypothetical protein